MVLVKGAEVVVGALLLTVRFVPLALLAFVPIAVNIALYHLVLDPAPPGMVVALFVAGLTAFLVWAYRDAYAPLKDARATPAAATGRRIGAASSAGSACGRPTGPTALTSASP